MRYVRDESEADDIIQEGFMKIFKHIKQFKNTGSFEGWMKRIIINTAINHYKKLKKENTQLCFDSINETEISDENETLPNEIIDRADIDEANISFSMVEQADFSKEELLSAIEMLKDDFKMVFKLFFFEEYKHQDIAELLSIDEKTSRSRLSRARKTIQQNLYQQTINRVSV